MPIILKTILLFLICAAVGGILAWVHHRFGGPVAYVLAITGGSLGVALMDRGERGVQP